MAIFELLLRIDFNSGAGLLVFEALKLFEVLEELLDRDQEFGDFEVFLLDFRVLDLPLLAGVDFRGASVLVAVHSFTSVRVLKQSILFAFNSSVLS